MYTEEQFTQLAEAKLYHYQHQQEQQETLQKPSHYHQHHHYHQQPRNSSKCDNVYVKMGDISSGNNGVAYRQQQEYPNT